MRPIQYRWWKLVRKSYIVFIPWCHTIHINDAGYEHWTATVLLKVNNRVCVRVYNSYNELKLHTTLHIKIDKLRQSIKTSDDLACVSLELYS